MRFLKTLFVCLAAFGFFTTAHAQVTGIYEFGPFDTPGFDTINRGNLNVHLSIPIFSKPGRGGTNFVYALNYDGLVWSPQSSSGTAAWTPAPSWGWTDVTNAEWGYITYYEELSTCTIAAHGVQGMVSGYFAYVYHDNKGNSHPIPYSLSNACGTTSGPTGTGTYALKDNSGLTIYRTNNSFTIATKFGAQFSVPAYVNFNGYQAQISPGAATYTDTNGNHISASSAGTFTDTMGKTALTVSGAAPNPVVYTYTDPNGNSQTVTVNYQSYTVQTAFGVSGIGEYSQAGIPLVSSIVYSGDGSTYSFTYEPTPGNSAAVTGRIASIKLPIGGVISYAYTGGSNGIESDGTTAGLTRTTSDGSTTYVRSGISSTKSGTTSTDPYGNATTSNFLVNSAGYFYEIDHAVYAGAVSGTPLAEVTTCYNVASSCASSNVNSGFSSIVTTNSQNGESLTIDTQNYTGPELLASDSNGISTTTYTYNTYTGPNSIPFYRVASVIASSQGSNYQETTYGYDETAPTTFSGSPAPVNVTTERGNLTSVHQWINSSGATLSTTNAYDTTGTLLSSTGPTGMTTFGHDSTGTFTTSVTPPTPSSGVTLTTSAQYDPNTGVPVSTTDPNGTQTTYTYTGMVAPMRVTSLDRNGNTVGQTLYNHESINQTGVYTYQSASDRGGVEPLLDGYGRLSRTALFNGQGANPFYQQDTCYDADGRMAFQSYRYQGSGWGMPMVCSGAGDAYGYDALGRIIKVTHGDGTTVTYSYNVNTVQTTDENGVSRIYEFDSLGRIAIVCEISSNSAMPSSGSPVNCGTLIPGIGFVTSYTYSLPNHTTTVTQGAQTRIFQTDWLGRTTSAQEPERGTTTYSYSYNGTGLVITRNRPQANQTNPGILTTTTTQYDSLGRVITISYTDGVTVWKNFAYDANPPGGWAGQSGTNLKGRLSYIGAIQGSTTSTWSASMRSYDPMGRVTTTWSCSPTTCGTSNQAARPQTYTYDWLGNMLTSTDANNVTLSYTYTPANEVSSVTSSLNDASHPPTLVSGVQNGPNGPISYQLGNGLNVIGTYDGQGRVSGRWVCSGTSQPGCIGGTQLHGFTVGWSGNRAIGSCDTSVGECLTYGYDQFNRVSSMSSTTTGVQQYAYNYDRYGNRWSQTALQGGNNFSQTFNSANNQISGSGYVYDAAGNLISDGTNTYNYDADGNLIKEVGSATQTFTYDVMGQQIATTYNGPEVEEAVFNQYGRLSTLWQPGEQNLILGQSYWGSNQLESYTTGSGGTAYFQHFDWLGTKRLTTTSSGAVYGTFTSLPFGDGWANASGHDDNTFDNFAGLWNGGVTQHAQYRDLHTASGRWLQPDPYSGSYDLTNPQSMNRYSYVLNNPVSLTDPSGLCPPPGRNGQQQPCGGGDGEDDGTIDGIDEFDFLEIPVSGYGFGYIPYQSWSGSVSGTPYDASLVNWGWGVIPLGTGADFLDWNLSGGSSQIANLGGGGAAPNKHSNPVPIQGLSPCARSAFSNNALALGLDAAGFIPGEGLAAAGIQYGIATASAVNSAVNGDTLGRNLGAAGEFVSIIGAVNSLGPATWAKAIPFVGTIVNGVATAHDLSSAYKEYQTCMSHP